MNDLQIFENPEFGQVRTVEIDGTPWLVGKDVAVALGYKNPGKAIIAHVDEEDKRLEMLPQGADSQNGNVSPSSKTALINESGLYSLILSSKMPKAKAFKRWVTSEVLPAIRKTGAYESFQAQQHIEQLEATNTRLNAAIQAVGSAKAELADVINLRNDFIKHRDNYKARFLQAKADYGKMCDNLRQAESLSPKPRPTWTAASTSSRSSPLACRASMRSWPMRWPEEAQRCRVKGGEPHEGQQKARLERTAFQLDNGRVDETCTFLPVHRTGFSNCRTHPNNCKISVMSAAKKDAPPKIAAARETL